MLTSASTESLWDRSQKQRFQQDGITASLGAEQSFSSSILIIPRLASTVKTRVWEGKEKGGVKDGRGGGEQEMGFYILFPNMNMLLLRFGLSSNSPIIPDYFDKQKPR